MNGTTGFTLKWTFGGINVQINCSQSAEGTVENPTGWGAGTAKATFTLKSCTVAKPSNCTVAPISMLLNGAATEFGGNPAVAFTPSEGNALFTLTLEGAKCIFKGSPFTAYGGFTGAMNSSSLFDFTEASSSMLIGGSPVTLTGTSKIETATGKTLKLAP